MIWAGSIHRKFGLYPCWRSKLSGAWKRPHSRWMSSLKAKRFRKQWTLDYWANHCYYNLEDRLKGLTPVWKYMWRRRP